MMKPFSALVRAPVFVKIMRHLFFIFLGLVALLSLLPDTGAAPVSDDLFSWIATILLGDPEQADKISHFIAYGVLAGSATLGLVRPFGQYLFLPVLLVAFSGVMELGQGFVASRVPDMLDMLANTTGVASGCLAGLVILFLAGHSRAFIELKP